MHPMMDPRHGEQYREEMWREVELNHLAKIVRAARKDRADMSRVSAPTWGSVRVSV